MATKRTNKDVFSPRKLLLPYQRAWADDAARWKLGLMARQVGKDFTSGEEGVRDCFVHEQAGDKTTWLIAAPSERQSLESLEKWKEWVEAYKLAIADASEEREGGSETLLKSSTITFPKGSRIIAVPGKPDTVRGFSANLLLTEFAFFEDPDRTWRAILPSITNPLRGGEKKVRLISTPNGQGNKFNDLWQKNYGKTGSKWSCHRVTIHDAVAQGLPVNIDELREAIDDPEGWAQEFECEFIDAAGVLLPYELIALCESVEATEVAPANYWDAPAAFPLDIGIDFARSKDLTVAWSAETVADLHMTKEVLALQSMSTPDQIDILRPRLRKARRVAVDYTGPGVGFGDYLVKEFGQWDPEHHRFGKILLCQATNAANVRMFSRLRMEFERRNHRIPISRRLRESLHSVYRVSTQTSVSYRAPHTPTGHADECYALALYGEAVDSARGGGIQTTDGMYIGARSMARPVYQPRRLRHA